MTKYRSHGQLDDALATDGDINFVGIDQLNDSSAIKTGRYQDAKNVRIKGGKIKTRDGLYAHNYYNSASQRTLYLEKATLKMVEYSSPLHNFAELVGFTSASYLGKISFPAALDGIPRSDFSLPYSSVTNYSTYSNYTDYGSQVIQAANELVVFPAYKTNQRPMRLDPTSANTIFSTFSNTSADAAIINMPAAPFGFYYQNRLIVPRYETSSTTTIISDILDINSFPLVNEFSANRGYSDITLGYAPMLEDQLLVLNKNSIHVISGIANGGERITEITRQHGIAGHSAYANNGSYIYFVSSEGNLEVLVPQIDANKGLGVAVSKLNLDKQPLSDMVVEFMERVNLDAIDTCVVHYAKNLVYFALPIDGSRLANAILIYDSLRSAFVGVDTFNHIPSNDYSGGYPDIHKLLIHDIKTHKNEVWLSTSLGHFKYKKGQTTDSGWHISTSLKTRDYLLKQGEAGINVQSVKKFTRGQINYSSEIAADLDPHTTILALVGSLGDGTPNPQEFVRILIDIDPADINYSGTETGWLEVGYDYGLFLYDTGVGYGLRIAKNNDTTLNQYANIRIKTGTRENRGHYYQLVRECRVFIKSNTTSPKVSNQFNKIIDIKDSEVTDSLTGFNISRRGQTINLEIESNSPITVESTYVEGFVANSRTVGNYA